MPGAVARSRILIVDDHELVRLGVKSLLEQRPDLEVVADVGTAEEGVARALAHRPDIVLLDIRLPGKSGIEACEQITSQLPDTKVIILTEYAEDENLFAAIRAGAVGYILKQVEGDDLIRAIEAAARGKASLDPALTQRVFDQLRESMRAQESSAFSELTEQELNILALVDEGMTNRAIAEKLFLAEGTVRSHVSSILDKVHVSNWAEATVFAAKHNLKDLWESG